MTDNKKLFPIESIPDSVRVEQSIFPSMLFPPGATIRAGDLQLTIVSANDKKDTVTVKLTGVYLEPLQPEEPTNGIILTPNKRIITP